MHPSPYSPPSARAKRSPIVIDPSSASAAAFGIRLVARLVDLVVGVLLGYTSGILGGTVLAVLEALGVVAPGWVGRAKGPAELTLVVLCVFASVYHVVGEAIGGATVGKWVCGLRVFSAETSPDRYFLQALRPCTFLGAFLRTLALPIDGIYFGLVAQVFMTASPLQLRLGDRWGKTIVVRVKSLQGSVPSPTLGVFAALVMWTICLVTRIVVKGL